MNQAFEEVKHYCNNCTARKYEGWTFCPFCGCQGHYHPGVNGQRVDGSGVVRPTKQTVNDINGCQEQTSQGQISSEEEHFNAAIKTVRETFDKLKRSRKLRERAEKELKEAVGKIHERDSRIDLLQQDIGRIQRPEPFAIRNVYGQLPGSNIQEVLGIVRIDQGYPVCDITVRLPR